MAYPAPPPQERRAPLIGQLQINPAQVGPPPQVPQVPQVDQVGQAAMKAMDSLRSNQCVPDARTGVINQLLRDLSLQRLTPADAKVVLKGLVEAVRNGYIPDAMVNAIANAVLGEISIWPEVDRAAVLRDFLVAIADVGHSDLLRSAITVSSIRLIEGYPEPSPKVRGDLTLWLGYVLVRNRIPQGLRDEVVRVSFACLRNQAVERAVRGKIAWVCSTLVDVAEYPNLPIEEIFSYSDAEEVSEKLREQIKNNLNRRALMSVGYF